MPQASIRSVSEIEKEINKDFGEDAVVKGSRLLGHTIGRMSTGVLSYDAALGGGWPVGHWQEIIGRESHGKTLLVQSTVAANQRADPKFLVLWIAGESVNYEWCQAVGMDLERVLFVPSNHLEQSYEIALRYMQNRLVDLVVIDSIPAMIPETEDEREFIELTIGKSALLNNKFFMRKSQLAMRRSLVKRDRPCTGLAVNQWRDRIGVTHGDPRTTPGGLGKNFAFFTRIEMTRTEFLKDGKRTVGGRFRLRTLKNKTAPVNRSAEVDFYFEDVPGHPAGCFDHVEDIVLTGLYYDIFGAGGGGNYYFGDQRWRGKDKLIAAVREDLDLQREIGEAVMKIVNPGNPTKRRVRIVR
jgi:recombination protein RecA